jgi:hypothetical protein
MTTVSTRRLLWLAGLMVIVALLAAGCSEPPEGTNIQPASSPDIEALPGDREEMKIQLPDGTLPCGLGQVEWGNQVFYLADYPSCQSLVPDVTVYCLGDQAQWTADAITISEITPETITLDAQREGICGIFPQK